MAEILGEGMGRKIQMDVCFNCCDANIGDHTFGMEIKNCGSNRDKHHKGKTKRGVGATE